MHKLPSQAPVELVAHAVDDHRHDAEERPCRRAGLEPRRARQRRDEDAAGLGLPPGVDDRAAAVADDAVVPLPGFRIDGLADRAEKPQGGPRGLGDRPIARLHQGADRRRCRVEGVDLVLVDHLPEAGVRRIVGHALEHQRGGAVAERSVEDVAVTGHPAHVGGAPVDVAVVIVEHVLVRDRGIDQVAARCVQNALGLAGRARRIEDEQRILGADLFARAVGRDALRRLVVVDVAAGRHGDGGAGVSHHDHRGDVAGSLGGGVGIHLQGDLAAAADAFVGGDEDVRARILDAAGE